MRSQLLTDAGLDPTIGTVKWRLKAREVGDELNVSFWGVLWRCLSDYDTLKLLKVKARY